MNSQENASTGKPLLASERNIHGLTLEARTTNLIDDPAYDEELNTETKDGAYFSRLEEFYDTLLTNLRRRLDAHYSAFEQAGRIGRCGVDFRSKGLHFQDKADVYVTFESKASCVLGAVQEDRCRIAIAGIPFDSNREKDELIGIYPILTKFLEHELSEEELAQLKKDERYCMDGKRILR